MESGHFFAIRGISVDTEGYFPENRGAGCSRTGTHATYPRTFLCECLNTSDVEAEVNDFMQYHNIISVNINTVDCRYHNNGGYNDVDIVYTIVYQD